MRVLPIMTAPVSKRVAIFSVLAVVAALVNTIMAVTTASAAAQAQQRASSAAPAARSLLAAAQAKLAFNLIEKVASVRQPQATVSPASLAAAFDLISIGADARMKAAIAKVLGFAPENPGAGLAALAHVRETLGQGGNAFAFADKIVFAPSNVPNRYMQAGLDKYGIPYEIVDLSTPEGAKKIDDWVKTITKGAIPDLLGGPVPNASFAALNALHFKSRWKTRFDPKQTGPAPFTGVDDKSAEVQMMHLAKATRAFRQEKVGKRNFVAIDLPFADERFSLVVATTTGKPATARDFAPVAAWLSGAGFAPHEGDLALPRFAASGREDLMKTLDGLGLHKARRSATALAGFGPGVELTQVIQRAMIEVDEEGAEAAAATAVVTTRMILTDDAIHMVVDKPFIYALRDRTTGLILVAGYVGAAPKGTTA